MRNAKMLIVIVLAALAPACGPLEWLNPCYQEQDLVFDPALVGTWKEDDSSSVIEFRAVGGKSYRMLVVDRSASNSEPELTRFDAHLVKLGDTLFLDVLPEVAEATPGSYELALPPLDDLPSPPPHLTKLGDGLYASLVPPPQSSGADRPGDGFEIRVIQAHWVFKIHLDGTGLRLSDLDEDWFKEATSEGKVRVGFERIDDTYVLTGSTEELRQLLLENGDDDHAFPKDSGEALRRQK